MYTFNKEQTGKINDAIAKVVRKLPSVRNHADDLRQDTWCKILTTYNPMRANHNGEPVAIKHGSTLANSPEGAYAFRVAYNIALDYLRGRSIGPSVLEHKTCRNSLNREVKDRDNNASEHATEEIDLLSVAPTSIQVTEDSHESQLADVHSAMATLSPVMQDAISVAMSDHRALTGSERIAKMRALDKIRAMVL